MICRIIEYLKKLGTCHKLGTIRLRVDMTLDRSVTFRIDGESMQVNWGDGLNTKVEKRTAQFHHEYKQSGVYDVLIMGENITAIDMPGCFCMALDLQVGDTLEFINCSHNQLKQLNIRHCKFLNELYCNYNQLEYLNLDGLSKLFYLNCASNLLKTISVRGCRNLVNLYCSQNRLSSLDLKNCCKLLIVKAKENEFDEVAILHFISTLRRKFNSRTGLLDLDRILLRSTEQIRMSILAKGWCEM